MDIIQREDGFFWPADDAWCHKVIHSELSDLDAAIDMTKGRTLAVQAGGNVGVWASRLAKHFATVHTFEPDATNYECLRQNVPANVIHSRSGLGAEFGTIGLTQVQGNAGAHYASAGGDIPVATIDALCLTACDLLILDVEGSEPAALRGAEQTIRQYKPVVMFEEKGLSERYYGIKRGTAEAWVMSLGLGYVVKNRVRADVILAAT